MSRLRRVDIERSEEVFRKIEEYVDKVVRRLHPHLVVLFGSFATGDINEGSDIDILVVADFQKEFLDRIRTLMDLNTFKIPIEPIGYTPAEFRDMKNRNHPFIMEAVEKGNILYQNL